MPASKLESRNTLVILWSAPEAPCDMRQESRCSSQPPASRKGFVQGYESSSGTLCNQYSRMATAWTWLSPASKFNASCTKLRLQGNSRLAPAVGDSSKDPECTPSDMGNILCIKVVRARVLASSNPGSSSIGMKVRQLWEDGDALGRSLVPRSGSPKGAILSACHRLDAQRTITHEVRNEAAYGVVVRYGCIMRGRQRRRKVEKERTTCFRSQPTKSRLDRVSWKSE